MDRSIFLKRIVLLSLFVFVIFCPGKTLPQEVENTGERIALTLDECIYIASENHLALKIAKKQLKLANFRLLEAKRKLGPTLTGKYEMSGGQVNSRYYDGEKLIVEGKQPVFYGGELVNAVKQAATNTEIVKTDYDRIKNDLVLQVKKAFYSLDKAKKALTIQKKLFERTKKLYDVAKMGYEAGIVAKVEFLKVSSQHNQADFQLSSAKEDLSVANLLLQQAISIDDEVEIVEVEDPVVIDIDMDVCFYLAYSNRPELKISRLSMDYFEYEEKIMKARSNWPRVDFLGSYGNTREDFLARDYVGTDDPRQKGPEYYYGAKVSIPFFGSTVGYSFMEESWQPVVSTTHGTKSRTHTMSFALLDKMEDISGAQEAELERARSKDDFTKKKQEITLEVKETFFKYKKAITLMNVAKSKIEYQTRQVEVLDVRRELGEALHSDVIEEIIKLAEERFSRVQAIADYYIAIASLNKAVGLSEYFVD